MTLLFPYEASVEVVRRAREWIDLAIRLQGGERVSDDVCWKLRGGTYETIVIE